MVTVEIRDFQSIEHVVVQVAGFTALVGRSNIGKSAIIRAVKAALTGAPADAYIRHGSSCLRVTKGTKTCKCYCSVRVQADGFDLLWEKGDAVNRYVFNGKEYTAANRGTPEFLEDTFGLVKIGDDKILLQVADQFKHTGGGPIFLLDSSGSVVADVLSDVAQLDRINVAARLAEKDRRESAAARKVREKDVMDLRIRLEGFKGLDDVVARVRAIELQEQALEKAKEKRNQLARFKDTVVVLAKQIKGLTAATQVPPPDFAPLSQGQKTLGTLGDYVTAFDDKTASIKQLEPVEKVVVPDLGDLSAKQQAVVKLSAWLTRLRLYKDLFQQAKVIEGLADPDIKPLLEGSTKASSLAQLQKKHALLEKDVARLQAAYDAANGEMASIQAETADLGDVCPTCTRPIIGNEHEHAAE